MNLQTNTLRTAERSVGRGRIGIHTPWSWIAGGLLLSSLVGCQKSATASDDGSRASVITAAPAAAPVTLPPLPTEGPGALRPGLSDAERSKAEAGRVAFFRVYDEASGLGPHYNDTACVHCHNAPAAGGASDIAHAGRIYLAAKDGVHALERKTLPGYEVLRAPAGAPVSSRRPPSLFGLGLLEAIPDDVVRAGCDPDDRDGDGVRGLANVAFDGRPGRFGWKAHTSTLRDFIADAFGGEMGLTNAIQRDADHVRDADPLPDPDLDAATIDAVTAYVQALAPPPAATVSADSPGGRLFVSVGCAGCHRPMTAPEVPAYSDLCVHDLGPGLADGIVDGKAGSRSWRTAPLWGLRYRSRYLHDERAADLSSAIASHGGEAEATRGRFLKLTEADRSQLLDFVAGL